MSKVSFLDKLKILGDVTSSSGLFIIAILLLVFLGYLFLTTNKNNAKSSKKVYLLIYISIVLFVVVSYNTSILKMFDYMMDNIFIVVYFPNLAIYLMAIIISNIILWNSMFNYKLSKIIKTINISIFCIIHYILILILSVITNNKLDIFNQKAIYSNKDCLSLIELSSSIFIIWILFLLVYKLLKKYLSKKEDNGIPIYEEKKSIKDSDKLVNKTNCPQFVYANMKLNADKKVKATTDIYDDLLTVDDYKLLLNILKDEKIKKEKLENQKKQEIDEQDKFRELQEMYRSVR